MINIILILFPVTYAFEYLSAIVHSQDVPTLPIRKLWHPHLYLAKDSSGEHYEIRHISQYYDVSISFLETKQQDPNAPGVLNCECRFVKEEIAEEEETTFLQVMTPSKIKPEPPQPQEKEIKIGTNMPPLKEHYKPIEERRPMKEEEYKYRPTYVEEKDFEEKEFQEKEYKPVYKKYPKDYENYVEEEPEREYRGRTEEYDDRNEYYPSKKEHERPRVQYVEKEYLREDYPEYQAPKSHYKPKYVYEPEDFEKYVEEIPRKGQKARKEPEYWENEYSRDYPERNDYRHNEGYYGRSNGYTQPADQDYVRIYQEPHSPQIVYVYPYEGQ